MVVKQEAASVSEEASLVVAESGHCPEASALAPVFSVLWGLLFVVFQPFLIGHQLRNLLSFHKM